MAYEGFTIPNAASATYAAQANCFDQDLEIVADGCRGNGIVYGVGACKVLPQAAPAMSVRLTTGGTVVSQGTTSAVITGTSPILAASANPRIDIVSVNNAGSVIVTTGAAAVSPAPPTIPQSGGVNNIVLAFVYVPGSATSIAAANIIDKRVFVNTPGGGGGAGTGLSYITRTAEGTLSNESSLGALATGYLKVTTSGGIGTPSSQATPIPVADGGTGAVTLPSNTILLGNGTGAMANAGGTAHQVMRMTAGAVPTFGAVDLSQAASLTGDLPVARLNAGIGASSSTFWRGDGTWGTPGGAPNTETWGVVTSDVTVNASSTLVNATGLSFAVLASEIWQIELQVLLTAAVVTPKWKFGWTFPAGTTIQWAPHLSVGTPNVPYFDPVPIAGTATVLLVQTSQPTYGSVVGSHAIFFRGWVFVGGTAGTVQFQFAQQTPNASNSVVKRGSVLVARKLA